MNAKVGHVVNLYGACKALEAKLQKLHNELNAHVTMLTEQEMGEYLNACERIDAKAERKLGRRD